MCQNQYYGCWLTQRSIHFIKNLLTDEIKSANWLVSTHPRRLDPVLSNPTAYPCNDGSKWAYEKSFSQTSGHVRGRRTAYPPWQDCQIGLNSRNVPYKIQPFCLPTPCPHYDISLRKLCPVPTMAFNSLQ